MPNDAAIANRKLRFVASHGTKSDVTVYLEKPVPVSDSADCHCTYRIVGPSGTVVNYATGVDALQAIQLAIVMIETELEVRFSEGEMQWEDGTPYRKPSPPGGR
ncbi:MAG: DUF6968 family protein [Bryobacteraceae bacterium]